MRVLEVQVKPIEVPRQLVLQLLALLTNEAARPLRHDVVPNLIHQALVSIALRWNNAEARAAAKGGPASQRAVGHPPVEISASQVDALQRAVEGQSNVFGSVAPPVETKCSSRKYINVLQ